MAVLPIVEAPAPVLASRAREVTEDEFGAELAQRVADMAETMYAAPGVGLAAPQVGDGRRMVVIDSGDHDGMRSGLLRMVNPVIVARSEQTLVWPETCLSVPDLEVRVTRNVRVTVSWREPNGEEKNQEFVEYEAVIIQHELDHLEGTVLLDRVSGFRRRRYLKKKKRNRVQPQASL
jgi:peptide deformylase